MLCSGCSGQGELSETCSPEALVHDPVTRMFWKNVKARSTNQASGPSTTTLAIPADQIGEQYSVHTSSLVIGRIARTGAG